MNVRQHVVIALLLSACLPVVSFGQTYLPVSPDNPSSSDFLLKFKGSDISAAMIAGTVDTVIANMPIGPTTTVAPSALPVCNPIPPLAEIKGILNYHQTLLSSAAAAKLGLPFGSASGSATEMILVRDWSRSTQCLATDTTTIVIYGQAIRTVIKIQNYDAKGDLSLAAVAANATISKKSSQVSVQVIGFSSPKMNEAIAGIASKELNVDTYGDFTRVESTLISLADANDTTQSVQRLGVSPDVVDSTYREWVATAFALFQIKKGRSCTQAKGDFPAPADPSALAVESTYNQIVGSCSADAPKQLHKLRAEQVLLGLEIKK